MEVCEIYCQYFHTINLKLLVPINILKLKNVSSIVEIPITPIVSINHTQHIIPIHMLSTSPSTCTVGAGANVTAGVASRPQRQANPKVKNNNWSTGIPHQPEARGLTKQISLIIDTPMGNYTRKKECKKWGWGWGKHTVKTPKQQSGLVSILLVSADKWLAL